MPLLSGYFIQRKVFSVFLAFFIYRLCQLLRLHSIDVIWINTCVTEETPQDIKSFVFEPPVSRHPSPDPLYGCA